MAALWVQRGVPNLSRTEWTSLVHVAAEVTRDWGGGVRTACGVFMPDDTPKGLLYLYDHEPAATFAAFCRRCRPAAVTRLT